VTNNWKIHHSSINKQKCKSKNLMPYCIYTIVQLLVAPKAWSDSEKWGKQNKWLFRIIKHYKSHNVIKHIYNSFWICLLFLQHLAYNVLWYGLDDLWLDRGFVNADVYRDIHCIKSWIRHIITLQSTVQSHYTYFLCVNNIEHSKQHGIRVQY